MITPSQASAIADLLRDCERALDPDRPQTGETLRMLRDDLRDWARDLDGLVRDGLDTDAWLESIDATLRAVLGIHISEQYAHNEFLGWAVSTRANGRDHRCMIGVPPEGATLEQVQRATADAVRVVLLSAWVFDTAAPPAPLIEKVRDAARDLWVESQSNQCRIREAGVMQRHVERLRAAIDLSAFAGPVVTRRMPIAEEGVELLSLCPHCNDPLCDDRCKETR